MSPRSPSVPDSEPEPAAPFADSTAEWLRPRLATATKEELVELVERLAGGSEDIAARIDYLTNPSAAAKALQRRIAAIRNGKRFIAYGESRQVASEIASGDAGTDWPAMLYELYQANDYGIREPLLEEGQRLLHEEELQALAAGFEADARGALNAATAGKVERHHVFASSSAMGLVARALRDPKLYEQSILVHSPEPNELQANDIAKQYLACGDGAGALRWLRVPVGENTRFERLDLLDRAYGLLGKQDRQIEIRRELYRRAPGIHSYRALEAILPADERRAFRARACQDAKTGPHVATAAELLFALEEPALAEKLIIERSRELDGRNYVLLTALVKTAKANGRLLAAALIWRALLDAILDRGYAKAYGHAAEYLLELRALSAVLEDYRGHPTHESYERALLLAHRRKASFWGRLSSAS
jgi:hypothetical protein